MDFDRSFFKEKNAVITGGASGIGLALAEELLKSGAGKVALADINQEHLDAQQKRLNGPYPGQVRGILCDVTVEQQVQALIAEAVKFFGGPLHLLFNNAGAGFMGWFSEMDNNAWKKAFDLNFYGALYGMRAALPIMQKQGGGQIINTISGIAFMPMAQQSLYSATKAALNGLTLALRYEYWDDHIKISSATPGTTATAIFGGGPTPSEAQTPEASATRILDGVVHNDKNIFGSDDDAEGASNGFRPEREIEQGVDEYLLGVARERRAGKLVF